MNEITSNGTDYEVEYIGRSLPVPPRLRQFTDCEECQSTLDGPSTAADIEYWYVQHECAIAALYRRLAVAEQKRLEQEARDRSSSGSYHADEWEDDREANRGHESDEIG